MDIDGTLLAAAHAAHVPGLALSSAGRPDSTLLDALDVYENSRDLLLHFQPSPLVSGSEELSAPLPFVWREPGFAASPALSPRRASRPSRPHAA